MKMTFVYLLVCSAFVLTSCATAYKMNKLELGMTKTEVIKKIGEPDSTSAQGRSVYLMYNLYETSDDSYNGHYTKYFVRLIDDRVESFGQIGDFDSTKDPGYDIRTTIKYE
ncbi:MAG: hypothetical protein LBF23_02260 [Endomicrobium sp.]|jgi:hypothetical protein|nr:hypothetical protein [Endomicrobium sp.]